MTIFYFFLIFCFFWWRAVRVAARNMVNYEQRKKQFLIIGISIFLLVIIGFRHYSIGRDTESYVTSFLNNQITFSDFRFWDFPEPLHSLLVVFVSSFTNNYTVYLTVAASFFVISVGIFVNRYSESPMISYIALLSLGYVYFSMAGLRQSIAIAVLLFAYKYVHERKLLKFLLLVAIAYGFHNTAIIFVIIYPIAKWKVTWKNFAVLGVAYFVMRVGGEYLRYFLFEVVKWERFKGYESYESSINLSGFIIQLAIILFCMLYYKQLTEKESHNVTLYNMAFVGAFIQLLTPIIGELFRLALYFSIFNIALIANVCRLDKEHINKHVVSFLVCLVLIIYFVFFSGQDATIIPYKFA